MGPGRARGDAARRLAGRVNAGDTVGRHAGRGEPAGEPRHPGDQSRLIPAARMTLPQRCVSLRMYAAS